jgi:hypothetical protein
MRKEEKNKKRLCIGIGIVTILLILLPIVQTVGAYPAVDHTIGANTSTVAVGHTVGIVNRPSVGGGSSGGIAYRNNITISPETVQTAKTASLTSTNGILKPGEILQLGQSIKSPNGLYILVLQTDGNLVLYDNYYNAIWSTGTEYQNVIMAQMQSYDGNLVLYNVNNQSVWTSNTLFNPGAYLDIQDDGNLVIYTKDAYPLWSVLKVQTPPYNVIYSEFIEVPATMENPFPGANISIDLPVDSYVSVIATGYAFQDSNFQHPATVRFSLSDVNGVINDWAYPSTGAFTINQVFHMAKGVHIIYLSGYADNGKQFGVMPIQLTATISQNGYANMCGPLCPDN